jgi:DNA topoisomerase-2
MPFMFSTDSQSRFMSSSQGLGTSDAKDAKKYFSRMSAHRIKFAPTQENDRGLIDMAFNKKKADDRKEWLRGFEVDHIMNKLF